MLVTTAPVSEEGNVGVRPSGSPEQADVRLRRLPYPYRALLAICSDLDETPNRQTYWEGMRFLNSRETTSMGPGLGLEVGNSIYFDMPANEFAYWNTDATGRYMVRQLIRSGHIDCLHSFGDLAITRAHAGRALAELARHGCQLEVWVDHAIARSNFGEDIMRGLGDVAGSPAYHADLTYDYGIRYVSRGRVTSIAGQDVAPSLRGIFNPRHPVASGRTLVKEGLKGMLARRGNRKYATHGPNDVLRTIHLRSGQPVYEFLRCNPHWGGVSRGETADGLAEVFTEPLLTGLVAREGISVLYTHLGKSSSRHVPFTTSTCDSLRLLTRHSRNGNVLVTTTRRLLGYCRAVREIAVSTSTEGRRLTVDVTVYGLDTPDGLAARDLQGLTFYTPDACRARIAVNAREILDVQRNGTDRTGCASISIPWKPLEFPRLCL